MIARIPMACFGTAMLCLPWLTARADDSVCTAGAVAYRSTLVADNTPTPVRLATLDGLNGGNLQGPIDYSSQHGSATVDGTTQLSGHVVVHMNDRELRADRATIDTSRRSVHVEGSVHYTDSLVRLQGDSGSYGDDGGQFSNAQFSFLKEPGHGSARTIELAPDGKLLLRDVTYTSCPPGVADWDLKARSISLDTKAGRGVGHGTRVEFKGIPVLYLPWLSFPLSSTRQSGFLFPSFATNSTSGAILSVPWYWNIAPNSDLTFTPTIYTNRGIDAGIEYRILSASNSGTFESNYMPHDNVFGSERAFQHIQDQWRLPDNWRLNVDAQDVSDTSYFEDFAEGTEVTSTAFLPRQMTLSHRDDIWNVQGEILNFQTLDVTNLAAQDRPYTQLPRLNADGLWHVPGLDGVQAGLDSEVVDFIRSTGVNGWRLDARPQLNYDLTGPGYFLRPSVAWEFTQYDLSDTGGAATTPERNLPIVVLDTGLEFERLSGSHGIQSVTLEPRLMYVYIPYRNQSQLPVFDTATPDQNIIELFQPNRYVGVDRIGDENALTFGLTTQFFENANGQRFLSATIGQAYYFQPPRISLPADFLNVVTPASGSTAATLVSPASTSTATPTTTSSLIAQIDLTAYRNWNLQVAAASTQDVSAMDQAQVNLQYRASGEQIANFGYSYQRGQVEQTDVSLAWPVSHHWDAYARSVYSLMGHSPIENFAGFQFRGNCWGLRAVVRRAVTYHNGQSDTGFYLQLELNGLSSVGTGADAFLKQSIRGYSSTLTNPSTSP